MAEERLPDLLVELHESQRVAGHAPETDDLIVAVFDGAHLALDSGGDGLFRGRVLGQF